MLTRGVCFRGAFHCRSASSGTQRMPMAASQSLQIHTNANAAPAIHQKAIIGSNSILAGSAGGTDFTPADGNFWCEAHAINQNRAGNGASNYDRNECEFERGMIRYPAHQQRRWNIAENMNGKEIYGYGRRANGRADGVDHSGIQRPGIE